MWLTRTCLMWLIRMWSRLLNPRSSVPNLRAAGIPFEQWPVMLSKRGDRVWMSLIQARKVANI